MHYKRLLIEIVFKKQ